MAGKLLQGWRVFPLQLEDLSGVPWESIGSSTAEGSPGGAPAGAERRVKGGAAAALPAAHARQMLATRTHSRLGSAAEPTFFRCAIHLSSLRGRSTPFFFHFFSNNRESQHRPKQPGVAANHHLLMGAPVLFEGDTSKWTRA